MNYFQPNLLGNYSIQNGYNIPQIYPQIAQPPYQSAQLGLNGKVVDSIDVVRSTDVPFNTFGVFPKGDMSSIYIKRWLPNGCTQIDTYNKEIALEDVKSNTNGTDYAELYTMVNNINKKLDILMPIPNKKKGAMDNE